jgi:hypothetical protein
MSHKELLMSVEFKKRNDLHSSIRKGSITRETHKVLKKLAIDFELDDDGKITPEALGECINHVVAVYQDSLKRKC